MTSIKQEQGIAEDILSEERNDYDGSHFWFGSLFDKKENALKEVDKINKVLAGTGVKANLEFARNFNPRGKDWGISIGGVTLTSGKKLAKKHNLKFEDYY